MKQFTKKSLKNGDMVKLRNGEVGVIIICVHCSCILYPKRTADLIYYTEDLKQPYNNMHDIMEVRRASFGAHVSFQYFEHPNDWLVYSREESAPEEMTLEEVCKALGKEIKIVKEKRQ